MWLRRPQIVWISVSFFVSSAIAGSVLSLLLGAEPPAKVSAAEVPRNTIVANSPPATSTPLIEPVSVGTTGTPESSDTEPVESRNYRGTLRVTSQPADASVFINGTFAGRTPLVIRTIPVGSRAVRVTLDGYTSWSSGVRIVANESTTVAAELHPVKTAHD